MKYLLIFAAVLTLQSCATLFTGTKDTIKFQSEPSGATVKVNGNTVGTTPCEVKVKRKLKAPEATISKDGYTDQNFTLTNELNPVSFLNLLSPIHWGIDLATGSVKRYDRREYSATLIKK